MPLQTADKCKPETGKSQLLHWLLPLLAGCMGISLLLFFPAGSLAAALCALIAPALILYGVRRARGVLQVVLSGLGFAASMVIMNLGCSYSVWLDIGLLTLSAAWIFPAFLVERCHLEKGRRFITTLVFPVCWITLFELSTLLHFGFQYRLDAFITCFSPFAQVAAIAGNCGVMFLMFWSVSVVVYIVENYRSFSRFGVILWAVVCCGCLGFGIVRSVTPIKPVQTVRIAYTTTPFNGDFANYRNLSCDQYTASAKKTVLEAAASNAEILVYNEEAFCISDKEEESFWANMKSLAREHHIHILAGLEVSDTDGSQDGKMLNYIQWITPEGETLFRYVKHSLLPFVETSEYVQGDDVLPYCTVSFREGPVNISAAICFDSNFSSYICTTPSDTQLFFLPSWDWNSVTDYHGEVSRLLAIENGFTLLKDTYDGASFVFSPKGETVYTSQTGTDGYESVHVADVPIYRQPSLIKLLIGKINSLLDPLLQRANTPAEPEAVYSGGAIPSSTVIILSSEVTSLILMVILLYALLFENSEKNKKTLFFILCCVFTIIALLADIPAWYFENKPGHDTLLRIANTVSLVASLGPVAFVSFYEIELIGRRDHVSGIHAVIISFSCIAAALITVAGAFTGHAFSIHNGVFEYGPWYIVCAAVSLAMLVYMEVLAVVMSKHLGAHDTAAFLCYMILPLTSIVLGIINPNLNLVLPATALSSLLLYVMLQSGHVSNLYIRGELLHEMSLKDMMTGLQNRRAYHNALDRLVNESVVNVVFCDINGLKYTNDTFGHEAGDKRILAFVELIKKHFSYDSIFRISGDEFVVLVPGLNPDSFRMRAEALERDIVAMEDIAAMGIASGKGVDLSSLVSQADNAMYEQKRQCILRHPEFKR